MTIDESKKDEFLFKYEFIRAELVSHNPNFNQEIENLRNILPNNITKESIWSSGRDKPCFSNIKLKSGEAMALKLRECNSFRNYNDIATDDWEIKRKKNGKKKKDDYELVGKQVIKFCQSEGGFNSYRWKLFCIREFAKLLNQDNCLINQLIEKGSNALSQNKLLDIDFIKKWVKNFNSQKSRPYGWGPVTSYHMLTDLGLAVKPDIHLVRSICRLGLLEGSASDLPSEDLKLTKNAEEKAVEVAIKLTIFIAKSKNNNVQMRPLLREVDKVLMEWSRYGLARPYAFDVYKSLQNLFFSLKCENTISLDNIVSSNVSLLFDNKIINQSKGDLKDFFKKNIPINQFKDYCHRISVVNENTAYAISSSTNENDEFGFLFDFIKHNSFWKIRAISKIINFK